jgi:hypothetical protein
MTTSVYFLLNRIENNPPGGLVNKTKYAGTIR